MGCASYVPDPLQVNGPAPSRVSQPQTNQSNVIAGQVLTVIQNPLINNLVSKFKICGLIKQKLDEVAYSDKQTKQLVEATMEAVVNLESQQNAVDTEKIKKSFKQIVEGRNIDKLFYYGILDEIKQKIGKSSIISQRNLSWIYYQLANIKKQKKIDNKVKPVKDGSIQCWQTNGYNKLEDKQIEEVCNLQQIGEIIENLGKKIKFKLDSVQKESENIITMLAECFQKYNKELNAFSFSLEAEEVKKAAEISRFSCNQYDDGVVLLLVYFVRSCRNLESKGKSAKDIENKLKDAIQLVSKIYPPSSGVKEESKEMSKALNSLNFKGKFDNKIEKLSPNEKQKQLEGIIIKYAKIAKINRSYFEDLLKQTCLQNSIQTKVGLKLDPDRPNPKAIVRIKEKMLFGKNAQVKKEIKETIDQTLNTEEKSYKQQIDELLKKKQQIQFKISDMVRGKCVFLSVSDIITTIEAIKAFVKKDTQKYKQKPRFRITEIESRFANVVPISDVTLKIAINQQIVAQLQLTIQSNAAAYHFSHRIYELQRTKVFSKLNIVHNYFEEFGGEFKQLASKTLQLVQRKINIKQNSVGQLIKERYSIINNHSQTIKYYVELNGIRVKEFDQVVLEVASKKQLPTELTVSTNKVYQLLMVPVFNQQIGSWYQQLGKQIDLTLKQKQNCSEILKASLLYFFFRHFDISKEALKMQQFYQTYRKVAQNKRYNSDQIRQGKDFMQFYLQQEFKIAQPYAINSSTTAKLYSTAEQIKSIGIYQNYPSRLLKIDYFAQGAVTEQNSDQIVTFLMQSLHSYQIIRDKQGKIMWQFDQIYQWLMNKLNQTKADTKLTKQYAQLLMAQKLFEENKHKQAQQLLIGMIKVFKEKEEVVKWLEGQLLLAECYSRSNKLQNFKEYYSKNVTEKGRAIGIEMKGLIVAKSEWRVYNYFWREDLSAEQKQYIEQTHLKKALTESSRTQAQPFILKIIQASRKGHQVFKITTIVRNDTVKTINLTSKNIGDDGCQFLSKAQWPQLQTLLLYGNSIGAKGCEHLSKAQWPQLHTFSLQQNKIGDDGCQFLSKAQWPQLQTLSLWQNSVGAAGCEHLSKAQWSQMQTLQLHRNKIGDDGCQFLSKAQWPQLQTLSLQRNSIDAAGCEYLIKAQWPQLQSLSVGQNNIGAAGCEHLSKAQWPQLQTLQLMRNSIQQKSIQNLWINFMKVFPKCKLWF